MDEIALYKPREISKAMIDATARALGPILEEKKQSIFEVPKKTFKYGALDRHELDIYYPPVPPTESKHTPVLFFSYGGGFSMGDKSISPLLYACLGAFFAHRGYIVVIPDYRLVPHVTFPGPAEDIRDALRWVTQNPEALVSAGSPSPDLDRIAMMAHSAGGVHLATMLFHPEVLRENDAEAEALRARISAVIFNAPPYDLSGLTPERDSAGVYAHYWGSLENAKENDPLHLYRRLPESVLKKLPPMLMVEAEFDPESLVEGCTVFSDEVFARTGTRLERVVARGHNHISINWALSSGQGEEWAEAVVHWLRTLRS